MTTSYLQVIAPIILPGLLPVHRAGQLHYSIDSGKAWSYDLAIKHNRIRELGQTRLRGTLGSKLSPTVEPDPGNAGGGNKKAFQAIIRKGDMAFFIALF